MHVGVVRATSGSSRSVRGGQANKRTDLKHFDGFTSTVARVAALVASSSGQAIHPPQHTDNRLLRLCPLGQREAHRDPYCKNRTLNPTMDAQFPTSSGNGRKKAQSLPRGGHVEVYERDPTTGVAHCRKGCYLAGVPPPEHVSGRLRNNSSSHLE
jgi:hypothetical protein